MQIRRKLLTALFAVALVFGISAMARAQDDAEEEVSQDDGAASAAVQRLSSADPLLRQQGAEELARLSANDRQKLVQGYYVQEKNSRVKLALAWALYRMNKSEMLFALVRDLDSSRAVQAAGYLRMLDSPDPLYMFLSNAKPRVQVELLKVLADLGNETTLAQIKPLAESLDPKVSVAAQAAAKVISERLSQTPAETDSRPRQVGNRSETSP
jgi:opacity protein-like surface antigen